MTTDQMRAEFEKWAKAEFFDPLYPYINNAERDEKGYYHTVTDNCWVAWQAAYAAGKKAEREAIVKRIRNVDGNLAWQSRIAFEALAEVIEKKQEGER